MVRWVNGRYPAYAYFVKDPCLFVNFLYVFSEEDVLSGMAYTKTNGKEIIRYNGFNPAYVKQKLKKVVKGTLILIDEYEIKGGCEDDNWR